MGHGKGRLVHDGVGRLDGVAGPGLDGGTVQCLFVMLQQKGRRHEPRHHHTRLQRLTLKVIHEMGSSTGIAVRLTLTRVKASSSKAKVKMAAGGVQVPTMRWWTGMVAEGKGGGCKALSGGKGEVGGDPVGHVGRPGDDIYQSHGGVPEAGAFRGVG